MAISSPFLKRMSLPSGFRSDAYPFNTELAKNGFTLDFNKPVTVISGENGSGKSTIIEAIAHHCGFAATGGSRNHQVGDANTDVAPLAEKIEFSWSIRVGEGFFMRAESFHEFSGKIDTLAREAGKSIYRAYGGKSLHHQSHGEAFLSLFSNRLGKRGIYLLDEPEAALSPQRQLALLALIQDMDKTQSAQFIIVTHSPLLMAYPNSDLIHIQDGKLSRKPFKSTTHFQILARFFANPEKYIEDFLRL